MATETIGEPLTRIKILVSPGRDHAWAVQAVDSENNALVGTLRLSLGRVVLTADLASDGSAEFELDADDASQSLLGRPARLDFVADSGQVTALAAGVVAAA